MPALKNQKHEAFAQLIVRGVKHNWSQGEAYQRAGYTTTKGAADTAASRLLKNVQIQARIAEIGAPAFRKSQITVETLLRDLEMNVAAAGASRNHAAVNGAIGLMAKLRGLLVDRTEIGPPGAFDEIKNIDDVAAAILDESSLEDALAVYDEIRDALLRIAAERAQDVTPSEPAASNHEVDRALAILRPERRSR